MPTQKPRRWVGALAAVPTLAFTGEIGRHAVARLHIVYRDPRPTTLGIAVEIGLVLTFGILTVRYGRAARRGQRNAGLQSAAFGSFWLMAVNDTLGGLTRRVTRGVEREARALGSELAGIRRLVPWLSLVPVVAFLLLTRWHRFRRSTTRVLATPHMQWRGNEFLRNLNSLLAAYTRAQALSSAIVGVHCWMGCAALGLPYPGTLALAAGMLEMVPLAGPLVMAVVATPSRGPGRPARRGCGPSG